jgi:hypothetical protein
MASPLSNRRINSQKIICSLSFRHGCCFTNGTQILVHQPLFYTASVKIMATFQCPKIISIVVFLLQMITQYFRKREENQYHTESQVSHLPDRYSMVLHRPKNLLQLNTPAVSDDLKLFPHSIPCSHFQCALPEPTTPIIPINII